MKRALLVTTTAALLAAQAAAAPATKSTPKPAAKAAAAAPATAAKLPAQPPAKPGPDDAKLNALLAKMEAAGKSVQTLQANISMQKDDPDLGPEKPSLGTIYFKANTPGNENVLLDYTTPFKQTVLVKGDDVTIYQPAIKQAFATTRKQQASKKQSLSFLSLGYGQASSQLRSQYNITYLGPETDSPKGTTVLVLKPKTPGTNGLKSAMLWVDASGLPVKSIVNEVGGKTTVVLSNVRMNPKDVTDSTFKIDIPSDIKVTRG